MTHCISQTCYLRLIQQQKTDNRKQHGQIWKTIKIMLIFLKLSSSISEKEREVNWSFILSLTFRQRNWGCSLSLKKMYQANLLFDVKKSNFWPILIHWNLLLFFLCQLYGVVSDGRTLAFHSIFGDVIHVTPFFTCEFHLLLWPLNTYPKKSTVINIILDVVLKCFVLDQNVKHLFRTNIWCEQHC